MTDYDELQREADLNAERLHKLLEIEVIDENANLINNEMNKPQIAILSFSIIRIHFYDFYLYIWKVFEV